MRAWAYTRNWLLLGLMKSLLGYYSKVDYFFAGVHGRPSYNIPEEQIRFLVEHGFTTPQSWVFQVALFADVSHDLDFNTDDNFLP